MNIRKIRDASEGKRQFPTQCVRGIVMLSQTEALDQDEKSCIRQWRVGEWRCGNSNVPNEVGEIGKEIRQNERGGEACFQFFGGLKCIR